MSGILGKVFDLWAKKKITPVIDSKWALEDVSVVTTYVRRNFLVFWISFEWTGLPSEWVRDDWLLLGRIGTFLQPGSSSIEFLVKNSVGNHPYSKYNCKCT